MSTHWINTRKIDIERPDSETLSALRSWHGQQRVAHNLTLEACRNEGRIPPLNKSPNHPDGLFGRLTGTEGDFSGDPRIDKKNTPYWVHRSGISTGRTAAKLHHEHINKVSWKVNQDLLDEEEWSERFSQCDEEEQKFLRSIWDDREKCKQWLSEHGDALPKRVRNCVKGSRVRRPRVRTWRDRLRTKKREPRVRIESLMPLKRVDDHTVQIARGVRLRTKDPLPPEWAIASFQIVETTPYIKWNTRDDQRQYSLHIQTKDAFVATTRLRGKHERWCGIDLGVKSNVTLHDGTQWSLPEYNDLEEDLVETQRSLSKCRKGSWRWRRARDHIRKIHRYSLNRDIQAMWDFANDLGSRFDVVCLEDLSLKDMSRSARGTISSPGQGVSQKRGLNRSLRRARLGRLKSIICRAFEKRDKSNHIVDPRGTSITCAVCGHKDRNSRESQALFRCTSCGHKAHADKNAAENVLARARKTRAGGGDCPRTGITGLHDPPPTSHNLGRDPDGSLPYGQSEVGSITAENQ